MEIERRDDPQETIPNNGTFHDQLPKFVSPSELVIFTVVHPNLPQTS